MEREEGGGEQCACAVWPTTAQDKGGSPGQATERDANRLGDRDRDPQRGGREARWGAAGRGGKREDEGQRGEREGGKMGGGRPAANDKGWRRWWREGPVGRGQGEWRRVGGL